ncbi:hypothetical protein FRC06_007569 [Ceratobasidium sp. 370]|nr:hypothetical protein FRC06_007569 [Ceratobasidium sp. 370]
MPFPLLIIPVLQHLVDKRKPRSESDDIEHGAQRRRPSRGNSNSGGKSDESPGAGAKWRVVREKVREGTLGHDMEQSRRGSVWKRIKDYLWGQEDEDSRGEYIPNYRRGFDQRVIEQVDADFERGYYTVCDFAGDTWFDRACKSLWYIKTEANKTIETQPNPKILDAGLAISMASAVLANVALICRFLERRVRLATFVAIDIINIVTVTIFGVVHAVDDGFTYGQAFWMTICSTIASVITTISLAWDLYRTPEFARSAVGFGDIILTTTLGRIFSIFYNTFGIINLGLAVSTTRETIIESFENSYRKRRAEREKMKHARAQIRAAEQMLRRMDVPVYVPLQGRQLNSSATIVQERSPRLGMRARTMTIASVASSMVPYPGGGRRHAARANREGMVLNVWALSEEQKNALFGDDAANMPGFCTFSTVGYGDFAPKTPAGRAFFVGWALFGIAAMTILISVLTEAYSSRYKTVIHSGVLDRAVKSIRAQRRTRADAHAEAHPPSSPSHRAPDPDALAVDIVTNARAIREHMAWFVNSSGMKGAPEGVLKVLDDIAEGENMDERVKKEFMSNDEARKTVFIMSFERMLHNLACAAEEAARMPRSRRNDDDDDRASN